jgi:hypothetical protein
VDLQSPQFMIYVIIGSIAVAVLAVVLYYFPGGKIRIPAIAATALTCLIAGAGIGVLTLYQLGYHWERQTITRAESPFGTGGGPPNVGGRRGGGEGTSRGRGNTAGGGTASQTANPKGQLAALVAKLDVLTRKPLSVQLKDEQKAKIRDQLKGLEDKDEIREEDAKKTLDALLEAVKENREALEDAGFHWPGEKGRNSPLDIPNPFKEKNDGDHLKSLRKQLGQADQLNSRIPPADRGKYQSVLDAKDWGNPYLVIRADGVEVKARNLPNNGRTIAVKDLKKTLTGLPVEAWPYGKVVAAVEIGIRSPGDDKAIEQNRKEATQVLEALHIKVEWWPSA